MMKSQRNLIISLVLGVLFFLILGGTLFQNAYCSNDYLKTKDVWGNTYLTQVSLIRNQKGILTELSPYSPETALELLDRKLDVLGEYEAAVQYAMGDIDSLRYWSEPNRKKRKETAELLFREYAETRRLPADTPFIVYHELQNEVSLYQSVKDLYNKAIDYPDYIQQVIINAETLSKVSIFGTDKDWAQLNIIQCKQDYYALSQLQFEPVLGDGFITLVNEPTTDILAFCMTLFFVTLMYAYFRKRQNSDYDKYFPDVLLSCLVFFLGTMLLYTINMVLIDRSIGLPSAGTALQAISAYRSCPYLINTGGFLLLRTVFKGLFFLTLLLLGFSVCLRKGKSQVLYLLGIVLFLVTEGFFMGTSENYSALTIFREINLFSALRMERFFSRYLNLNLFRMVVPRLLPFLLCFFTFLLFLVLSCWKKLRRYRDIITAATEQAYVDEINQKYNETRQIWHDIHNHLQAVSSMIEHGDNQGARKYLEEVSGQMNHVLLPVKTGSNVLDALIFKKFSVARDKELSLHFDFSCSLQGTTISDYDLCSIFGNLLDNALEAMEKNDHEHRSCDISIRRQNSLLYISCSNPYSVEPAKNGLTFITTKKDSTQHGLGITRIRTLCRKYNGQVQISANDHLFTIEILLTAWEDN